MMHNGRGRYAVGVADGVRRVGAKGRGKEGVGRGSGEVGGVEVGVRLPAKPVRRATPHGLRVAAIDIGTNSLHMVMVEVTDQLSFKTLGAEKDLTQLGESALVHHRLTRQAMTHTKDVLSRYQRIAQGVDCDVILAYATSAVRECSNGGDFVAMVREQLGLTIQVISSQEEARLIYLAVRQAIDVSDEPVLIVDIGGGSAEFIVGTQEKALLLQSRKLGASRLTQQFVHSDPIAKKDLGLLEEHIQGTLKQIMAQVGALGAKRVIGTSGTMENLVAMCLAQHGEEHVRERLLTHMTREDFGEIYKRVLRLDLKERKKLPGLDPGRAEQIVAGATLVNYVFEKMNAGSIEVCDRAMREGMIMEYMQKHWPKVKLSVQVRDPRRRSVIELGRRCNYDEMHSLHVAKIALELFDQLKELHGLGEEARELLDFAAQLHDIGWHIGHNSHHKHSYYLIKNGDLEGFSPVELEIIANVARYHRRSAPKKSHDAYMGLRPGERDVVWKLGSILRIADGMDRGHYGNVQRVKVTVEKGRDGESSRVNFRLYTVADPELELWGGEHKTDMFERIFGVRTRFSARTMEVPGALVEKVAG